MQQIALSIHKMQANWGSKANNKNEAAKNIIKIPHFVNVNTLS